MRVDGSPHDINVRHIIRGADWMERKEGAPIASVDLNLFDVIIYIGVGLRVAAAVEPHPRRC